MILFILQVTLETIEFTGYYYMINWVYLKILHLRKWNKRKNKIKFQKNKIK